MTLKEKAKSYWLTIVLAIISAGGISHVAGLWEFERSRDDSFAQKWLDSLDEISLLSKELHMVKAEILQLKLLEPSIQIVYWIKDKDGRMLYINQSYCDEILRPLGIDCVQFINSKVEDYFPPEIVEVFNRNDHQVIHTGRKVRVKEEVPTVIGGTMTGLVIKYPIYIGGKAKFVAGYWLPLFPDDCPI